MYLPVQKYTCPNHDELKTTESQKWHHTCPSAAHRKGLKHANANF